MVNCVWTNYRAVYRWTYGLARYLAAQEGDAIGDLDKGSTAIDLKKLGVPDEIIFGDIPTDECLKEFVFGYLLATGEDISSTVEMLLAQDSVPGGRLANMIRKGRNS